MFGLLVSFAASDIAPVPKLVDDWKPIQSVTTQTSYADAMAAIAADNGVRYKGPVQVHQSGHVEG